MQTGNAISVTTCLLNYMVVQVLSGFVSTYEYFYCVCIGNVVTKTKICAYFSSVEISAINLKL